jgi:hypothetical protein
LIATLAPGGEFLATDDGRGVRLEPDFERRSSDLAKIRLKPDPTYL